MRVHDFVTLVADPEVRYTQGENPMTVVNIRVASKKNRAVKEGEPDADFFRLTALGKTADTIAKFCVKGSNIYFEGRMQNDNYEKDGQTVYRDQVVIETLRLAGGKRAGDTQQVAPQASAPAYYGQPMPMPQAAPQPMPSYGQPTGYAQPMPQPMPQQPTAPNMAGFVNIPDGFPSVPVA